MKKAFSILVSSAILLGSYPSLVNADDAQEDSINYRQSTFKMVKWHMGPMAAMVKGKIDFDAAAFASNAAAMANLSKLASNGFLLKSPSEDSRSKASIWENKADFDQKMQDFVEASDKLLTAAQSNDLGVIKPAFGALGKSCKSCHNDYRLEK